MRGFKTIRSRIFTILSIVIVISALSVSFYLVSDLKSRTAASFESVTQTINKTLVANISEHVYNQDKENMKHVIGSIQSSYISNIVILDPKGYVITAQKPGEYNAAVYPNFTLLNTTPSHTLKQDDMYKILNRFELLDVPLGYVVVEGNVTYYHAVLNPDLTS